MCFTKPRCKGKQKKENAKKCADIFSGYPALPECAAGCWPFPVYATWQA
jgi:hypothetical protein